MSKPAHDTAANDDALVHQSWTSMRFEHAIVQALDVCRVPYDWLGEHEVRFVGVPVSEQFNKQRTNLLIACTGHSRQIIYFVDSDLAYHGPATLTAAAFHGPCRRNWRQLLYRAAAATPNDALKTALKLLESPVSLLLSPERRQVARVAEDMPPQSRQLRQAVKPINAESMARAYRSCQRKSLARRLAVVASRDAPPASSVLWGQAGVGLSHLMMATGHVAVSTCPVRQVYLVSGPRLVVGSIFAADMDAAMANLLEETTEAHRRLFLVERLDVCLSGSSSIHGVLAQALDDGLRIVATVQDARWLSALREDESLARRVLPVHIPPLSREQTIRAATRTVRQSGLKVPPEALQAAAHLADQTGAAEPGATINALHAALAEAAWRKRHHISPDDVLSTLQPNWPE